jgi:hypothetical protein
MARTIKRGGKKTGAKKSTSTNTASSKAAAKKNGGRKKLELSEADVKAIAKRLRDGEKMQDIWQPMGLSTGQGIRKALVEHGFDSKGRPNPDGLSARELQVAAREEATKAASSSKRSGRKASSDNGASKATTSAKKGTGTKRARKGRKGATVNP